MEKHNHLVGITIIILLPTSLHLMGLTLSLNILTYMTYNLSFCYQVVNFTKPLTVWITTNCGKFFKRWEYQTTWPASWEICVQVKKQQLELYMEQTRESLMDNKLVSNWEKEYVKAVYCHPAYLTSMQSTSCNMPGWMKHKLESRFPGEISITSDMQMTPPLMAESEEELKSLLMKMKEESEKAGLKLNIQKTKIMASGPIPSWETDEETMETVRGFILAFILHCRWWP